jgi:hypothetical protein
MTWWRRDPTFAPAQHYAQRILRSHEAALRTRCFSRTPSKSAQHEDNHDSKRPSGMSNLEWLQLQQHQRWRKKLVDDPYQAIFGASNDMLSGKGLKDWEWISKSFPKWMLREMESHDNTIPPSKHDRDSSSDPRYPRRVEIKNEGPDTPKERASHFPQPSFRASQLLRDDPTGVQSPSDPRRPREQSPFRGFVFRPEVPSELGTSTTSPTCPASVPQNHGLQQPTPTQSIEPFGVAFQKSIAKRKSDAARKIEKAGQPVSATESSSVYEVSKEQHNQNDPHIVGPTENGTWRETTLQRRSPKHLFDVDAHCRAEASTEAHSVPPTEEHVASLTNPGFSSTKQPATQEPLPTQQEPVSQGNFTSARSTSKILSQLPEDDLDFLSADDIRAKMAARKSKVLSDELRKAERAKLERTFEDSHKERNVIDSMLEAKVINDQFVRRIERQMQQPERSHESQEINEPRTTTQNDETPNGSQLESSVERMRSWLEESGAKFSSLFWQDPTEEADAKKTRLFFDNILARIRKSRVTMKQVIEDLEKDVPASKPLLKRMKADEDLLDSAINALRQGSTNGKLGALTPKKVRAIQELRLKYQSTDNDLTKAYAQLQELGISDAAKNVSLAFKRRLSIASKITQKNAHLTRYLIWSLQARLEDPEIEQRMLPNYKAVANSLLTLRDTQMALARLLERAMLVYGVAPQTWEDIKLFSEHHNVGNPQDKEQPLKAQVDLGMSDVDKAQLRAKVAAEERLANEVDAQKAAMCGLSDDGYARVPKSALKKSFEERGPLAHSLFRPFGPVLENLESKTPSRLGSTETEEKATRKIDDDTLAHDVQKVYEDTNGLVTVDHKQSKIPVDGNKAEEDHDVKKFDMLKDDPAIEEISVRSDHSKAEELVPRGEITPVEAGTDTVQDTLTPAHTCASPESVTMDPKPSKMSDDVVVEVSPSSTASSSSKANSQMLYTILVHDPDTGNLSLTTSTSAAPRDVSPAIPLHEALSRLDQPVKFIPHIKDGLEIVTVKKDMLILRDALNPASSTKPFETVNTSSALENNKGTDDKVERGNINPIDGMARLSPTGYVGPEESQEQLEKEFAERRRAAERVVNTEQSSIEQKPSQQETKGKKKGGKGAGVVKTAIWAATLCYVAGVLGEVAS